MTLKQFNLLSAFAATALLGTSSPAPAIGTNDLIDLAIDLVNPDLKPLRPTLVCAASGTNLTECAKKYGQQQLAEDPDANQIIHVFQLANNKQYTALVAEFGTTAVCTSMGSAPGINIVCNAFAQELIAVGGYAAKQAGTIVGPAGKAALLWIGKNAGKFGCAIGFACPKEANPNVYIVDLGPSGTFSLNKFDLAAIWQKDYAPRIAEAVQARFSDPNHYKLMLLPANAQLNRFMMPEQLGSGTVNALAGATTDGPVWLYKAAFTPFQKELNLRFAEIVNREAALRVEDSADRFEQNSGNWMSVMLTVKSEELFDAALPSIGRNGGQRKVIDTCRTAIDQPATALWHWGQSGIVVDDATLLNGKSASYWAGVKGWCESKFAPALANDIAKRRKDFDTALSMGCTRRPDSAKGLICPAIRAGTVINLAGPMSYCQRAYKASAKRYCSAVPMRAPAARSAPEPSPSPSATAGPIRTRTRIPGI